MSITSGHLASNGGLRGHSAGDIFPFILFMKGDRWRVMNPDGSVREENYSSAKVMYPLAQNISESVRLVPVRYSIMLMGHYLTNGPKVLQLLTGVCSTKRLSQ